MKRRPKFLRIFDRDRPLTRSRDRSLNVIRKGSSHSRWRDPYHLLLIVSWPKFLAIISLYYVVANALFALAYLAGGDCIENAHPGSFADAFFFSVQTMASIGYGAMYPRTYYANLVVAIEALAGLMALSMATGLMFARFSRPTARVLFSRVAAIAPHHGVPTLMFRAANERHNQILSAEMRVSLLRDEVTAEGQAMRRFYDMKLLRSNTPIFMLTWTVMHPIDEMSPLYGLTAESLAEANFDLIVTLTGLDETVSQTIHARHYFGAQDIRWNMRFVDILSRMPDGLLAIDYTNFHDVTPL
ncbi:ion channel [Argonema antarcticum]|uniref:ion channel n=1 Tax=Argonema antarcticum TaxID=2942763 RepID=UPI002012E444|nr:ion channel [Argonema antarcticum]MCL1475606.1 ATP-sensitive inward rectifier potassium channel 10 [Argonema antarcticum A004/B2]